MKDLTQVIKQARHQGHILLSLELDFGTPLHHRRQPEEALSVAVGSAPYLLLYADDRALAEPNSVAASLQRYDPLAEVEVVGGETNGPRSPGSTGRVRREAPGAFRAVHDNELPDVDIYRPDGYRGGKESQLESTWYLALKSKSKLGAKEEKKKKELEKKEKPRPSAKKDTSTNGDGRAAAVPVAPKDGNVDKNAHAPHTSENTNVRRPGSRDGDATGRGAAEENRRTKEGKEGKRPRGRSGEAQPPPQSSQVLSFDEQTMRKARRRQWGGAAAAAAAAPAHGGGGGCSRKNLRVDFADIGWSEWVIAPKAFEAYYCSGTCGFPMPKVRASTHSSAMP